MINHRHNEVFLTRENAFANPREIIYPEINEGDARVLWPIVGARTHRARAILEPLEADDAGGDQHESALVLSKLPSGVSRCT